MFTEVQSIKSVVSSNLLFIFWQLDEERLQGDVPEDRAILPRREGCRDVGQGPVERLQHDLVAGWNGDPEVHVHPPPVLRQPGVQPPRSRAQEAGAGRPLTPARALLTRPPIIAQAAVSKIPVFRRRPLALSDAVLLA